MECLQCSVCVLVVVFLMIAFLSNLTGERRAIKKVLSELPNVPERIIYNYTVSKVENESFGISIVGGLGTILRGIYVKSVAPSSACGKDGSIKVGKFVICMHFFSITT